jgi:hypothetical protein
MENPDPMDPSAISGQVNRILSSRSFASKSQLRKLLEVLSKNIDSQTTLTPDLVIKELWPDETRTKRSADVATEMNRLRHALESYYGREGKADPIVIVLPNRTAPAADGTHETRWIVAKPRESTQDGPARNHLPGLQANPRTGRKKIALVAALSVALCIVAYISFRVLVVHDEPKSGRLDGSTLTIMDAEGKELWSKKFPEGFGPNWYYDEKEFGPRIWFADLEGKGHTSVLFSYLPTAASQPHSSSLICYSDRGKEKWRWTPGRDLPEINGPTTYKTFFLGMLKATEKRPARIVILSNADPWWGGPSQIAILDSKGKTLSEYWHAGGLLGMAVADPDGDGGEEIIATGVAHGYDHQATLVVLNPDRVFGASTEVMPKFQIRSVGAAQEKLRLLFPRSDLNRASFEFNYAIEPAVEHGNLRLKVLECVAPPGCPIWYEFDKDLHIIAAYPVTDEFRIAHDRFYQNGKDAHTLRAEERAAFLRVRCLVGCKTDFVPVAETYNPATFFERAWTTHSNPGGAWSYGYSWGFAKPITLYDKTVQNGINGKNAQFWLSSLADTGTSPAAEYNNGLAFNDGNVDFLANEFLLVAGIRGQYSDLVFTAPVDGEYSVAGNFRGAQYGIGTVVGIVANGKVVFSSSVTSVGRLVPFNMTLRLQAGSTVTFSVGPAGGAQNTGLSATITRPCALTDRAISASTGEIRCSAGQRSSTVPSKRQ